MEPVISPWVFYLIDNASGLKWGALIFGVIVGFIFIMYGAFLLDEVCTKDEEEYDEVCTKDEEKYAKKKVKTGIAILIIGFTLFLIMPSSETVMKMVVAKNVTYDTVNTAKDVVVQVYNDILALFQK